MSESQTKQVTDDKPPVTDIRIDVIALRACHFEDYYFDTAVRRSGQQVQSTEVAEGVDLEAKVNVWFSADNTSALVQLVVSAAPKAQPSWRAEVDVIGQYSVGANPVVPLRQFAWNNGIAYLVPYVRERLASLTAASEFEAYYLPPLNVASIVALAKGASGDAQAEKPAPK